MTSTCQDNGEWTPVEQCLPSHCIGLPPFNVASSLETYYQNSLFSLGQDPPVGAFLEYRCPPDHFFESNQSLSSFEVECGPDGQFENPVTWPICIEKLTCSTSDLLTSIFNFYPQPHIFISNPGDTFTMSCGSPAFAVAHVSNSTTYSNFQVECLETGLWNVSNFNDFKCLRIGCDLPSAPHGFIGPVLFNSSFFPTFVPFDQSVAFVCPPHQRLSDDFDNSRLNVFCRDDGVNGRMEMPSNIPWCVEHTKCSTRQWDELVQLRKVKDLVRRADKSSWTATGSPLYYLGSFPLSNMFDNDSFTLYHSETSFLYSWIEVDLQTTLKVYLISIAKRFTSCCQRYQGIETRVGSTKITLPPEEQSNQAITINQVCRRIDDYSDEGYLIDFKCITPIEGRYVTIQKMGRAILQLNNVEIYHVTEYADDEDAEIVAPLARDCEALYQLGFKAPGIYRIDPTGLQSSSSAIQVHCENGWTLVLKRDPLANDKIDFSTKTLTEIENLLGSPTQEFWIGLQALHKLTISNHYKLTVTMTSEDGNSGMAQYEHLSIEEGPEYTMKVEGFSTLFGLAVEDDLSENSETSFVVSGRCFETFEAPGWYNPSKTDCGKVNLFGAKMIWASLGRLSAITMKIKPTHKPQCALSSGECVFPWTYSLNGRTYLECDFVFDPTVWCPTKLNADGVYISGSGHWASCPTLCPGSAAADYGLINPGGFLRDGTPRSFETFKLSCPQGQTLMVDGVSRSDYETTCNWDKSWTEDVTVTCEVSSCDKPPIPPNDTHLILHGWNGEPISIEENWEFVCPDGLQPPGEPEYSLETKVVIQVKCLAGNTFAQPSTWPKCVSRKQCPAREGPPSTPINGSAILTNRGTTFGPCIDRFSNTFQCNGQVGIRTERRSLPCTQGLCSKYSIIFNPSQPIQSQFLRIQFSSNVNLVSIDNGHEVSQVNQNEILISGTNLNAFPGSTTSFAFEVSHEAIPLKTLPCVYEFQCSDNNNDGWFELPSTTNGTFDPTTGNFNYGSTITYKCGPGLQFVDEQENPTLPEQNFTCGFDEEWFPASPIQRCEWSHCASPPNVPDLVPKFWNESNMTPIGSNLTMICARGMKFEGNLFQTDVNPTCSSQNQWEDPMNGWGKCVETVFCDPPPSTIPKGSIDILQSGLSFGTSCLGSQMREPIPTTDCPALEAQINEHTGNSTKIRLLVKHPSSIRLTMLMIFSQPINVAQAESTQVSVLPSGTENVILTSMNLDGAYSQFNIQIAHASETKPCFLQAMCSNCLSNTDCLDQGLGLVKNLDLSLDLTQYGTTIAYKCPPGQRFVDNSSSQILSCGWNKQWQPSNQLLGCEVVACANPPLAPNGTRLMNNYTMDDEVAFNDHVSYFCPDGYFFEQDYDQQFFNLTCLIGGNWSVPLQWPRCLEPREKFCHDPPQPPANGGTYDWNKDSFANGTSPFGLEVRYSCDIARQLENQTLVQSGQDPLYDEAVLKCAWNGKWFPSERLDPCVWNKCINPPIPNGNNLKHSWHGQPLDFYENVTYTCAFEGYWFEDDRDLVAFDVPCLPGGRFGVPSPWPLCLHSVECESPPPKPRGGIWNWDGTSREYGTTIEYECGPNAMFQEVLDDGSPGNFYKSKSITCNWNRTWTPERLDRCIWSKCNAIPEPGPSTGLQFVPDSSIKSLQILTNYSKYMPEIPLTLAVSLDFRSGSSLLLDGYLHDLIQDNPRLILTNEAGKKFLDITIEPFFSLLKVTSDLRPNFEYEEILQIDTGAPFKLEVGYLPEKFEFQLTFNDESLARFKIPDSLPDLEIESLILTGDVEMNYVGRKPKGFDSRVAVGTKVEFTCPSGQVFEHNWYARPSFKMTCLNTGVFDAPNIFPSCVEPFASTHRTLNASEAFTDLFPTSDDENVIVTLPTNNPALGPVEFPHTTRYHWPNFDLNATDPNPEDFEVVSGPNLFREAVELKQGHDKCLIDKEFAAEDDTCIRNPVNCEDGFSFSLFFKPNYDLEPHQFFNASKTFFQEYIVSTGGDKGSPGFGIYIQGGDIGAVVSTGVQVWKVQVKGGAPDNKTWTNLAIKWEPPLFNTEDELEELLTVKKKKFHELGGLQLYRNLELIGQTFHPDEDVEESGGEQFDQPEIMIGCHRTPQDSTPRKFSHGSYDELAFWARALNATEEVFFLGGYKDVFEDVGTDDLLKILNFIDYADVNQADTAINIMDSIVNGEEEEEAEFRNIYPETTPTPSESLEDENGTTSTVSSSTTTTTTEAPKKDPTKDVKNLMKIAKKLTSTDSLNYYITKREFDVRMKAVGPLGEFMGVKGKYAEGWTALKKDKNEAGPFETLTNLKNYVKYNVERYTVVPPDSRLRETRRVVSTNNFVMEAFKMTSTNFGKLGSVHNGGYFQFPNWNSPEWAKAKASFGYTQGQDRPTESVDISSELFTEECKKNDVNFVGMISDTFPDHGRKNPSFIYANHIEMDSRVITLDITANQMDTDPDSPTFNKFGERCEIDPKLAVKDPFILKFAIKSKRNHDFGRKLTSYYDSFDDKRVINRHCVIWNEDIGPYGAWDTRGVTLVKADDAQATCYATKLGIYAIVAEIEDVPYAEDDETWLNIVKYIGYAISIILLLIFIGVILSSTYLWEMFHLIAVNMAFSLLFGHIFMLISELDAVRDDRDACSAIGLLILFFYSALSVFITMECYAMFKAIISGIIGGHTRTYLCFGYGVPLLHIGVSIFIHLQEMGTDPRCMVGWANEVKEAFYIPLAIFGILSVFLVLVMVCNINTPAMRKESMVEELGSLAKGLGVFVLLYALTWSWFPFAYMRFPTQEFPDFYPAFQVMNSFMGMFFFVFIGLMSNRFRTALTGGILMRRKALLADESADDNYVEQVNEDSITTMEDIEPEDEENEEDVEAAPRSRPESGKSVKEEQSENPDPDPEEEDVVNNDPVKNNNSPDPNPNEAEED